MEQIPAGPAILLTGDRRNDRFDVMINGQRVRLTATALNTLIDLVLARSETETGFLHVPPLEVCRLRQSIDSTCGSGIGKVLVETGSGEEYRIQMSPEQLRVQLVLSPGFLELTDLKVVSSAKVEKLREHYHIVKSARNHKEIKRKLTKRDCHG